jgi:hypothetical protein
MQRNTLPRDQNYSVFNGCLSLHILTFGLSRQADCENMKQAAVFLKLSNTLGRVNLLTKLPVSCCDVLKNIT